MPHIKLRTYASLVTFILVFSSLILTVYAYFVRTTTRGIIIETEAYQIEIIASFDGNIVSYTSPFYDPIKKVLIVNAYDPNSDNYIGDLEITIYITPYNTSRLRIKLFDEWELTRTYIDQDPNYPIEPVKEALNHPPMDATYFPFSSLKIHPSFQATYHSDGYAYIHQIVQKNQLITIPFIEGGDRITVRNNDVFYEEVYVYIDLRIDIVQANRFSEVWGIDPNFFNP